MAFCGAWANKKGDLRLESAVAKIIGSEWYWEAVNDLFQVRGGRGFMTVEAQRKSGEPAIPVMRMLRDARINLVWEGTSEILRIWMARESLAPYLEQGLAILQGSTSKKLAAARYYARMACRASLPFSHVDAAASPCDKEYAQWRRLLESSSRRLTRSTLMATLSHRQKLHNKQLLLQHLVNESLLLFPLAATLWYASQPEMRTKQGIRELVHYCCQDIAERLHPASTVSQKIRRDKKDTMVYRLSKSIMSGEYAWLEDGILPSVRK